MMLYLDHKQTTAAVLGTTSAARAAPDQRAGSRWRPVPHKTFAATMTDTILAAGWRLHKTYAHVERGGTELFACWLVGGTALPDIPDGWHWGIGLKMSNARRFRPTVFYGVKKIPTPGERDQLDIRGAVFGSAETGGRMTEAFDHKRFCAAAVEKAPAAFARGLEAVKKRRKVKVTRDYAAAVSWEAVRAGVVNVRRMRPFATLIGRLMAEEEASVWDMQAAVGTLMEGKSLTGVRGNPVPRFPPADQMDVQLKFHKLIGRLKPAGV